jgi:hypothetical protein
LPRKYLLWVELPSLSPWGAPREIALTSDVSLVETVEADTRVAFSRTIGELVNAASPETRRMVHVRVRCSGFAIRDAGSTAAADGASKLKQFFSAAEGSQVFTRGYYPRMLTPDAAAWLVDESDGSTGERLPAIVPDSLRNYLAHVAIAEEQ